MGISDEQSLENCTTSTARTVSLHRRRFARNVSTRRTKVGSKARRTELSGPATNITLHLPKYATYLGICIFGEEGQGKQLETYLVACGLRPTLISPSLSARRIDPERQLQGRAARSSGARVRDQGRQREPPGDVHVRRVSITAVGELRRGVCARLGGNFLRASALQRDDATHASTSKARPAVGTTARPATASTARAAISHWPVTPTTCPPGTSPSNPVPSP